MKRLKTFLLLLAFSVCFTGPAEHRAQTVSWARCAAVPDKKAPSDAPKPTGKIRLPALENSVRFLAVGDTGRGNREQKELANVMLDFFNSYEYDFAILTGDNIYGKERAKDMKEKFEDVYRPLLDRGVEFYASLGNHDESNQRFYEYFNMGGREYYNFRKGDVSFYALNSNYLDPRQLEWIEKAMAADDAGWKIAFFHHPPYSSGKRHGSSKDLREVLEPVFVRHGVDAVFVGHEHFYERIKPQKGVYYFITGAGGKIRKGNVKRNSPYTEKAFDTDLSFMLVEIKDDKMYFQVVSRSGETVDDGVIQRPN